MSEDHHSMRLAERVRHLAGLFVTTDLLRIRIEREGEEIELGRKPPRVEVSAAAEAATPAATATARLDTIKADLVGVFHLGRPAPGEGDLLEADRELGYIEALGIRNPVRSLGAGRIISVKRSEGEPVEYGEVLFEIDRG